MPEKSTVKFSISRPNKSLLRDLARRQMSDVDVDLVLAYVESPSVLTDEQRASVIAHLRDNEALKREFDTVVERQRELPSAFVTLND